MTPTSRISRQRRLYRRPSFFETDDAFPRYAFLDHFYWYKSKGNAQQSACEDFCPKTRQQSVTRLSLRDFCNAFASSTLGESRRSCCFSLFLRAINFCKRSTINNKQNLISTNNTNFKLIHQTCAKGKRFLYHLMVLFVDSVPLTIITSLLSTAN